MIKSYYRKPIAGKRVGSLIFREDGRILCGVIMKWDSLREGGHSNKPTYLIKPKWKHIGIKDFMERSGNSSETVDFPHDREQIKQIVRMMIQTGALP